MKKRILSSLFLVIFLTSFLPLSSSLAQPLLAPTPTPAANLACLDPQPAGVTCSSSGDVITFTYDGFYGQQGHLSSYYSQFALNAPSAQPVRIDMDIQFKKWWDRNSQLFIARYRPSLDYGALHSFYPPWRVFTASKAHSSSPVTAPYLDLYSDIVTYYTTLSPASSATFGFGTDDNVGSSDETFTGTVRISLLPEAYQINSPFRCAVGADASIAGSSSVTSFDAFSFSPLSSAPETALDGGGIKCAEGPNFVQWDVTNGSFTRVSTISYNAIPEVLGQRAVLSWALNLCSGPDEANDGNVHFALQTIGLGGTDPVLGNTGLAVDMNVPGSGTREHHCGSASGSVEGTISLDAYGHPAFLWTTGPGSGGWTGMDWWNSIDGTIRVDLPDYVPPTLTPTITPTFTETGTPTSTVSPTPTDLGGGGGGGGGGDPGGGGGGSNPTSTPVPPTSTRTATATATNTSTRTATATATATRTLTASATVPGGGGGGGTGTPIVITATPSLTPIVMTATQTFTPVVFSPTPNWNATMTALAATATPNWGATMTALAATATPNWGATMTALAATATPNTWGATMTALANGTPTPNWGATMTALAATATPNWGATMTAQANGTPTSIVITATQTFTPAVFSPTPNWNATMTALAATATPNWGATLTAQAITPTGGDPGMTLTAQAGTPTPPGSGGVNATANPQSTNQSGSGGGSGSGSSGTWQGTPTPESLQGAGFYLAGACAAYIRVLVYVDANQDNIMASKNEGVEDVTVYLLDADYNVIDQATTQNGVAKFCAPQGMAGTAAIVDIPYLLRSGSVQIPKANNNGQLSDAGLTNSAITTTTMESIFRLEPPKLPLYVP